MDLLDTRRPRLLLVAFCLILWLPGVFTLPPTDRDESRFAQASKQMLETGDYVRIMNGTEPRNRKPIGIYWLQVPFAAAARAAGLATTNPVWPYRVPSLLGGLLAVLAVQSLGGILVGRREALLAAGMLAASVLLTGEVHLAKTDAALLGATTLCMALLARSYITAARLPVWQAALFWGSMAAGILLKGPITPLVVGLTVVTLGFVDRRLGWVGRLRPAWGVPLMIAAVLPWFAAIEIATGGSFFRDAVGGDLGRKLAGGEDAHWGPPGLHLLLVPLLAFPSSLAVVQGIRAGVRGRGQVGTRFLLAWAGPSWLVFEAVPTKLPHYPLPLYPALFLLAALALKEGQPAARTRWLPGVVGVVLATGALMLPPALRLPVWSGVPAAIAAGLVGWLVTRTDRPLAALAAMPLLYVALLGTELPAALPLWIAPRVERSIEAHAVRRPLGSVGFHEPSLVLLAGTATQLLQTGEDGAHALANRRVGGLLVADRDQAAFGAAAAALGLHPALLDTISGFNYSRGRWVTLRLYDAGDQSASTETMR